MHRQRGRIEKWGEKMKKKIGIVVTGLILITLVIYVGNIYHPDFDRICGTGVWGLKLAGAVGTILLLALVLTDWPKNKLQRTLCQGCAAEVEETWSICPYCGLERGR